MTAIQKAREALDEARKFIAAEYADASAEMYGEWLASEARPVFDKICRALAALDAETGVKTVPTQRQMNEAFYVDVCQAEDRLKEFIEVSRKLIASLPDHWHGEAETELNDLCDETDAVLNPHMHTPYQVEQATKRYGRSALVTPEARS